MIPVEKLPPRGFLKSVRIVCYVLTIAGISLMSYWWGWKSAAFGGAILFFSDIETSARCDIERIDAEKRGAE